MNWDQTGQCRQHYCRDEHTAEPLADEQLLAAGNINRQTAAAAPGTHTHTHTHSDIAAVVIINS